MLKSPAFSTSFLERRMIQKLKSRKSRIKPGLFAFLLAEHIIFGKKTQKSQVSLLRYLTFSLVCGRIWQRGAPAGPPAVRVVGACSPVGCVQARPRRQPRQVLLPLPQNRRKHWVFAGFLFSCVAWLCGAIGVQILVFPTVRICCTPLQHPKRTRFRLFLAESGAFSSFSLFFWCKIFVLVFVHPAA